MVRLASLIALVFVGLPPAAGGSAQDETRIVPPLAAPSVVPGIGRCTSDGACTVTDAAGTRSAAPLRAFPP